MLSPYQSQTITPNCGDSMRAPSDETSAPSGENVNTAGEHIEYEATNSGSDYNPDGDYKIDTLFHRITSFSLITGINFYGDRNDKLRYISFILVALNVCFNLYFIGYVTYLTLTQPFETSRVATSIQLCTWVLQATLSVLFLAYWKSRGLPLEILKQLHEANQGRGIHVNRKNLTNILKAFYVVIVLNIGYLVVHIVINLFDVNIGYLDRNIAMIYRVLMVNIFHVFGDRRLFLIGQLSMLCTAVCWIVWLFVYSLLIHTANYEFDYFNEQVRSIKGNQECQTDEALCDYILKLMKNVAIHVHNRLTGCVKLLDTMFHRYAFVMIATIIPTTIFSFFTVFMVLRRQSDLILQELLLSLPLVVFCVFCFCTLVNAPSQLHKTISDTKSSLCANTQIWFPYRPNVYHSALAFVCHLDQINLGVSIWGFAVVSKPLVLTTLSVMMTCLAIFLQIGDCNSGK